MSNKLKSAVGAAGVGTVLKQGAQSTLRSALQQPAVKEAMGLAEPAAQNGSSHHGPGKGLVVAAGVAGVTAASAAVSAIRRKHEGGA